jgi:hypothetical protein
LRFYCARNARAQISMPDGASSALYRAAHSESRPTLAIINPAYAKSIAAAKESSPTYAISSPTYDKSSLAYAAS